MTSFKEEFERIVAELRAHPKVEVFGAELGEPADATEITEIISAVGITPTKAMLDFYTAHNGAHLEWGLVDTEEEYEIAGMGGEPEDDSPPGFINILSAKDAFSPEWQEEDLINPDVGEPWNLAYGEPAPEDETTAIMVDNFSLFYQAALLLGSDPLIVITSDHGADLGCSDLLTFPQYLELVIAQYGSNPYNAVGIGWERPAERLKVVTKLTLDAIVENAVETEDE